MALLGAVVWRALGEGIVPELPEVETIRRGLALLVEGTLIEKVEINRPDLRFAFPKDMAERLEGQTISHLGRRAKYLLFSLSSGETLLSHLGMTGNYRFADTDLVQPTRYRDPAGPRPHDHVVFHLKRAGETGVLLYSDPRRFGFFDLFADPRTCAFLSRLGPEPLGNQFSAIGLAVRLQGKKAPIKTALLDQSVVAGLGNIYVNEALWRAHIAPATPSARLVRKSGTPTARLEALVAAIRAVLDEAIAAGGSTLKDFRNADGETGYFQHRFDVYDRAGALCRTPGCSGTIRRVVQSGRASFYCPVCQRK